MTLLDKLVGYLRQHGLFATLLLVPFKLHLISLEQLGSIAARLGAKAKVDSTRIPIQSSLIKPSVKGGLMLGGYEKQERQLLRTYLSPTVPVIELGASIGVVSCVVDHLLAAPKREIVVEANPELIPLLQHNRMLNHCQFEILEAAIAYGGDTVTFFSDNDNIAGGLYQAQGKKIQVSARTLRSIAESAGFQQFNLICDIEGGEVELIEQELALLQTCVSLIVMEVHPQIVGRDRIEAALRQLHDVGFELVEAIDTTCCLRRRQHD